MVIKIKEVTIGRNRKWAWDYGNGVGYNVSITIEGTTAKDTVEDMIKTAILELVPIESSEQTRCRNIFDIARLQGEIEYKEESVVADRVASERKEIPNLTTDSNALPETNIEQKPKRGKPYTYYKPSNIEEKVRLCNNDPCPYYLRWVKDKGFEHGKFDPNKNVWSYIDDRCEYYSGGS